MVWSTAGVSRHPGNSWRYFSSSAACRRLPAVRRDREIDGDGKAMGGVATLELEIGQRRQMDTYTGHAHVRAEQKASSLPDSLCSTLMSWSASQVAQKSCTWGQEIHVLELIGSGWSLCPLRSYCRT